MITGWLNVGIGDRALMTRSPPARLTVITSASVVPLAASIAARRLPGPLSAFVVTVKVAADAGSAVATSTTGRVAAVIATAAQIRLAPMGATVRTRYDGARDKKSRPRPRCPAIR